MANYKAVLLLAYLVVALSLTPSAEAGGIGKIFGQSVMKRIMRTDLLRDRATIAKVLAKPRTVFRYTSQKQAAFEVKYGLQPGTHMTSTGGPGRPLSAKAAQKRFGLASPPEMRETLRLENQAVKHNKVLAGSPGYGELTSPQRIPSSAVRRIVSLQ